MPGDGELVWLSRSLPKEQVRVTGPPDVGPMGSPLLSIGTSVSEKARTVKGSVVEEKHFSRPHPKKERLVHPLLETPGLSSPISGTVWHVSRTFAHFVKI